MVRIKQTTCSCQSLIWQLHNLWRVEYALATAADKCRHRRHTSDVSGVIDDSVSFHRHVQSVRHCGWMFPEDGAAMAGVNVRAKLTRKSRHFPAEAVQNQVEISVNYCSHNSLLKCMPFLCRWCILEIRLLIFSSCFFMFTAVKHFQ